ncbi:Coronin-1A [Geodia barretti]|uniref:Coronin n=1 Tax=Geodia barretti TaxID=519541 RepID=A0AA35STB3_GEOBA|nr:Coronin-1A [Geodia barretti]
MSATKGLFVRSSKFRHVFGTPAKKDKCYDNLKISKGPHESDMSAVNSKFIAVVTEVRGGGSFIVLPLEKVGRIDINYPKVTGHRDPVLDVAWNPFNENEVASASEDCTIKLWDIPDGGLTEDMKDPSLTLEGHQKKVGHIRWHPSATNVLASASADNTIRVWNTETGGVLSATGAFPDMIQSICWNYNGSRIATTCKDKKIRVVDARTGDVLQENKGHDGNKPSRVVFCGKTDKLFTSGFSRMSERQFALWDVNHMDKPLAMEVIDNASGVLFPFWDDGTNMVYLVGKGDTNIRYFEVTDESPYVFFLSMYQSSVPARSVCSMPKRHMDFMKCEVMRFFKVQHTKGLVEPLSMTVPRKSEMFQGDIFPACPSEEPALTAEEWISGTNKDPILMEFSSEGAGSGPVKIKAAAAKKKPTVRTAAVSSAAPSAPGEFSTLEEYCQGCTELENVNFELYRKAYKLLEEENKMLRAKLGM